MHISYKLLWHTLIERNMRKEELRLAAGLTTNKSLPLQEGTTMENRPIGRYGRLHRDCLKEVHPARYSSLVLTGKLWTYLVDLNE